MADFQPFGVPQFKNPQFDLVEALSQGYKAGQMPAQMKRNAEQEELANALQRMKVQNEPENERIANSLRESQTQKYQQDVQKEKMLQDFLKRIQSGENVGAGGNNRELAEILQRKLLGLPEETPSEKSARELREYKAKEGLKADMSENPTVRTRTMNQGIIQAIDNTLPLIEELKVFKEPNQFVGKHFNPNAQASYEAQVATITDALVSALNLPKTNESINLVGKIVQRRPLETHDAYIKRLDGLKDDLDRRRKKAENFLRSNKSTEDKKGNKNSDNDPLGIR